jgi:hypothetical protein
MKQKNRSLAHSIRYSALAALVLLALTASACGPETLVVGLEPTPTPTPLPTPVVMHYTNEEYGFAFRYPETWELTEEPHVVRLNQDTLTLTIAYGWASSPGFSPGGGRTGVPAGDFIYGDKIFFLEQAIPAQVLEYQRKDKMVLYGGTELIEAEDLVFDIWLEDMDSVSYEELDIGKDVQDEVKEILESFERIDATGEPPEPLSTPTPIVEKDLLTYVNQDYRLALIYPSTWQLEELPADQEAPNSAPAVHLTRDALRLTVQFKLQGEETVLGPGGRPAGEVEESGSLTVMGRPVPAQALVYQGKVKSVFLGDRFDDLELYVQLDAGVDAESDYEAIEIPESARSEMEAILSGMTRTGEQETPPAPPQAETLTYENEEAGFSFQHPATWAIDEVTGETMEDGVKIADAVVLSQGTLNLIVQYQRKSDPTLVAWGGGLLPADMGYQESVLGDRVTVVGVETHKRIWADDEEIKAVTVAVVNPTSDLLFDISLTDGSARSIKDADAKAIPDAAMAALDQVLASLTVTD